MYDVNRPVSATLQTLYLIPYEGLPTFEHLDGHSAVWTEGSGQFIEIWWEIIRKARHKVSHITQEFS
jgi:hypothetical protein